MALTVVSVDLTDDAAPEKLQRRRITVQNPFADFADTFRAAWDKRDENADVPKSTLVNLVLPFDRKDLRAFKNDVSRNLTNLVREHIDEKLSVYTARDGFVMENGRQKMHKTAEGNEVPLYFFRVYVRPTRRNAPGE